MTENPFSALEERKSDWFQVDAGRVSAFADTTEDWQFVHLDDSRAKAETPFGGCIAHGFLTLSMLSAMSYQALSDITGVALSVNYGFDRVRFVSPVRVGSRIRGVFKIGDVHISDLVCDVVWDVEIEIENHAKPALVAQWRTRAYLEE